MISHLTNRPTPHHTTTLSFPWPTFTSPPHPRHFPHTPHTTTQSSPCPTPTPSSHLPLHHHTSHAGTCSQRAGGGGAARGRLDPGCSVARDGHDEAGAEGHGPKGEAGSVGRQEGEAGSVWRQKEEAGSVRRQEEEAGSVGRQEGEAVSVGRQEMAWGK